MISIRSEKAVCIFLGGLIVGSLVQANTHGTVLSNYVIHGDSIICVCTFFIYLYHSILVFIAILLFFLFSDSVFLALGHFYYITLHQIDPYLVYIIIDSSQQDQ